MSMSPKFSGLRYPMIMRLLERGSVVVDLPRMGQFLQMLAAKALQVG